MRTWVAILCFLFSVPSFAENIDVRFNDMSVNDFTFFVVNELMADSFIFDNEFLQCNDRITARLSNVDSAQVFDYLKEILFSSGFVISTRGNMHYIRKIKLGVDEREVYIYFPKFRSADYLRELAGTVVDFSGFSSSRLVSSAIDVDALPVVKNNSVNDLISRKDLDSIVFLGKPADILKLEKLFAVIDQPVNDVVVNAVVYEVRKSNTDNNAINIALGLIQNVAGSGLRVELGKIDTGNGFRVKTANVDAFWSVLSADSRFRVVTAPSVRIQSGGTAKFTSGEDVPTLGSVTHNGNGQSVQSVEYKSSGVILSITPFVHNESIDLIVDQQLSNFAVTTNGVNDSPTLIKRELKTRVSLGDDELVLLAGLDQRNVTNSRSGFSFLPDFALGRRDESGSTEILLLLHVRRVRGVRP
jgi:type II secretory pathway component GspD/PulD (secretin)